MRPTGPMAPGQLGKPVAKSVPPVSGRVKLLNAWAGAPVARTDPAMRERTTAGRLATESSGRTVRMVRERKSVAPGMTDSLVVVAGALPTLPRYKRLSRDKTPLRSDHRKRST